MIQHKKNTKTTVLGTRAWMRVLPYINEMYASALAKKIDVTYSHVVKIITGLEHKKWITREKQGRIIRYKLTPAGEKMRDACDIILLGTGEYKYVK